MNANKVKAIYLLMYMAFAIWRVYYNVYLEEDGFSGAQIGTLNAMMQATLILVVPFWGIIADRRGIRPTLLFLVLLTSVMVYLLGCIHSFWLLLFFIPLLTFFYHPLGPLTDALAVQYAETEQKQSYGSLRLWGSLGWALASVIGGVVFFIIPIHYIFMVSAATFLILSPLLITYHRKKIYRPNFQTISIKKLLNNRKLLFFIIILTLYGVTCSPVNSYLNLYFKELNAGYDIIGYAYAIMAFSEVPFFLLGNKILKSLGARKIIIIAMVAMLVRLILYGFVPNIYLALSIGALQGISLSFFLLGAVDYLNTLMPAGMHATTQSIIWTTYVGIGQTIGNLSIGPMIDGFGMIGVMQIFIVVSAGCLAFTAMYFYQIKKQLMV